MVLLLVVQMLFILLRLHPMTRSKLQFKPKLIFTFLSYHFNFSLKYQSNGSNFRILVVFLRLSEI